MIFRNRLAAKARTQVVGALLAALAIGLMGSIACSREGSAPPSHQAATPPPSPQTIPAADRPPAQLAEASDAAAAVFDAAFASDWPSAGERLQQLTDAASSLPSPMPKADIASQLDTRVAWLGRHIADKQRVETMDDANAVTRATAELSAEYQTDVPYEVKMLEYYGRQLELGIASGRIQTLTRASTDLRSTWNRIEPAIERRGRIDDARRFTDLVVQVEGARRVADYVAPTRAELTLAEQFDKAFRSAS
jgi:hypothetical protein